MNAEVRQQLNSGIPAAVVSGGQTYILAVDPRALSTYVLDMKPAGQYEQLSQEIEWYGTANEATLVTTLAQALTASELGSLFGVTPTVTPVDLSTIGDNAHALGVGGDGDGMVGTGEFHEP